MIKKSLRLLTAVLVSVWILHGSAIGQNTIPVSAEFDILDFKDGIELLVTQASGTLLPEEGVTITTNRPDTLPEIKLSASLLDTIRDSLQTVAAIMFSSGGNPKTFKDTFRIDELVYWPQYPVNGIDSLFAINFNNQSPVLAGQRSRADRFTIMIRRIEEPALHVVYFAQDTVKGISTDTSRMLYLGGKVRSIQFGIRSSKATPEINYIACYNNGFGWGQTIPPDTIMLKTETDDAGANAWLWVDEKDIMAAQWMKIIRIGAAAADTTVMQEHIRLERSN